MKYSKAKKDARLPRVLKSDKILGLSSVALWMVHTVPGGARGCASLVWRDFCCISARVGVKVVLSSFVCKFLGEVLIGAVDTCQYNLCRLAAFLK